MTNEDLLFVLADHTMMEVTAVDKDLYVVAYECCDDPDHGIAVLCSIADGVLLERRFSNREAT